MTLDRVKAILGSPDTTCVQIRRITPSGNLPPTDLISTQYFYPRFGMELEFYARESRLDVVTFEQNWVYRLENFANVTYSCQGPRPLQMRAELIRLDASGVSLGSPAEAIFQVFGQPDGSDQDLAGLGTTQFVYLRRGIIFTIRDERVIRIEILAPI